SLWRQHHCTTVSPDRLGAKQHFSLRISLITGSVREVLQKPLSGGHGMRVVRQSPDPLARMHTMTKRQGKSGTVDDKALLSEDEEFCGRWSGRRCRRCSKRR